MPSTSSADAPVPNASEPTTLLTVAFQIEGNPQGHAHFFQGVLKTTNFEQPTPRTAALHRIVSYLVSQTATDGFVTVESFSKATKATATAKKLSRQQIRCVDSPRDNSPTPTTSCIAGFTLTISPERAEQLVTATGGDLLPEICQQLRGMSVHSMDAFYVFYAPAPKDVLSQSQAKKMLSDLRTLSDRFLVEAA